MRKKICLILIPLLFLVGCTALPNEQKLRTPTFSPIPSESAILTPSMTLTIEAPTLRPSETKLPITSTILPTNTVSPLSLESNFDEGGGNEISSAQMVSGCIGPKNATETSSLISNDIIVYDKVNKEVQIRDKGSFKSIPGTKDGPSAETQRGGSWDISPDSQWLLYSSGKSNSDFNVGILNIKTGKQIQQHFEGLEGGHILAYWGDENHIIIPLANEDNLFKWEVWDPFTQEVNTISARLPGMGDIINSADSSRVYIYPVYDYAAGIVIYACSACGQNEYQAYNVQTGRVQWGVDLGKDPLSFAQYPPIVSSNGEYIAIYFGENKIWILNKNGESILRVILPRDPDQGGVAQAITWSHDGQYLAFTRDSSDPDAPYVSVISIEKNQMYDLCDTELYYGTLLWSYDSQYLLHERDSGDEKHVIITILGINSNQSSKFTIPRDLMILDWVKP